MSVAEIRPFDATLERLTDADYSDDFRAWALAQAALIRAGDFQKLDIENVAEELESLGRQEARELRRRYAILLTHLLKWRHQPDRRSPSWEKTIRDQRREIADLLQESPSLKAIDGERFTSAYEHARWEAAEQTRRSIKRFPTESPFTLEQARDPDFWPEAIKQ